MRLETFTLSQKELQRVSVISACIKGDMACASAAALLCLSVRQSKRLKKRLREAGEAALAHANRGRPSHRRLPERTRLAVLRLARTKYAGFNDTIFAKNSVKSKASPLPGNASSSSSPGRSWLAAPTPRSAHRQRRVRSPREGELLQLGR